MQIPYILFEERGGIDQKCTEELLTLIPSTRLEPRLEEVDDGACVVDQPHPHLGRLDVEIQLRGRVESPPASSNLSFLG